MTGNEWAIAVLSLALVVLKQIRYDKRKTVCSFHNAQVHDSSPLRLTKMVSHQEAKNSSLEIVIFGEQPFVFHTHAYASGDVTPNGLVHFSNGWRRSGTTSDAVHCHAMEYCYSFINVYNHGLSCKYKDGVVRHFPVPSYFERYCVCSSNI